MREHDERRLRAALQQEADRHQPDRDAMFDRIIRTRAEPKPRLAALRLRPALAAAGVAVVVVASFAGIRLASSGDDGPDNEIAAPTPAATVSTPAPEPSVGLGEQTRPAAPGASSGTLPNSTRTPSAQSSATPGSKSPRTPPSTGTSAPPRSTDKDGFLTAKAGLNPNPNPNWSQSEVELTTTGTMTAFDVTITIRKTAGFSTPGMFSTVPKEMIAEESYAEQGDKVVYRWRLKDGPSLSPGEYLFAAQYNHAEGRKTTADTYAVTASAGPDRAEVEGTF